MGKSPEKPKEEAVVMGYQTQQQMYPPPYNPHGYPNTYQPHPAYVQQEANNMNPNPYYYHQQPQPFAPDSDARSTFGRRLLLIMLITVSSVLILSMIGWVLFGASIPEFEVASISVSNFTATNTSFSGKWSVGMWVSNLNVKTDVNLEHVMSSILYRDSLLGIVALDPFVVRSAQRLELNFTVPSLQLQNDQNLQSWVLPSLADDRRQGAVVFSLGLVLDANFTSPDAVYRKQTLRVLCADMEIKFSSPTGDGTWSPGLGHPCFIRLHEEDQPSSVETY